MKRCISFIVFIMLIFQSASAFNGIDADICEPLIVNTGNDTMNLFALLGIFENGIEFLESDTVTPDIADSIFEKLFTKKADFSENITNQDVFAKICVFLGVHKAEKPYTAITSFSDFGFVSKENRGYYESVFREKSTERTFLNPHKNATYGSFFETLGIFKKEIFELNGFEILTDTVVENSFFSNVRTIKTRGGYEFKIDKKQNAVFLGIDAKVGTKCEFVLKDNELYAINGIEKESVKQSVDVGGIYKGSLFFFDFNTGKVILKNLYRYENNSFVLKDSTYCEFASYGNFITVCNFKECDRNVLNNFYLDKEITFITALEDTEEKIVCIYLN